MGAEVIDRGRKADERDCTRQRPRSQSQKQNEISLDSISGQRLGMRYMTPMAKQLLSDEKRK